MNRSNDCKKIERASARRKTPLKKAPVKPLNQETSGIETPERRTDKLSAMKSVSEALFLELSGLGEVPNTW